jgi:hypothetical protein
VFAVLNKTVTVTVTTLTADMDESRITTKAVFLSAIPKRSLAIKLAKVQRPVRSLDIKPIIEAYNSTPNPKLHQLLRQRSNEITDSNHNKSIKREK